MNHALDKELWSRGGIRWGHYVRGMEKTCRRCQCLLDKYRETQFPSHYNQRQECDPCKDGDFVPQFWILGVPLDWFDIARMNKTDRWEIERRVELGLCPLTGAR